MARFLLSIREALLQALRHDVFNTAKAAAYSGMLCLFPAVVVLTTVLAQVPEGNTLVGEMRGSFEQFMPVDSLTLLQSSLQSRHLRSVQVIFSAASLSVFAALGLMLSLMEGFRRAYQLPRDDWGFWQRRARALLLVPIVLVPLFFASLVLVFGRQIEGWMIANAGHELRHVVLFSWRMVRWTVAVLTGATVLAALYHFGMRQREHWFWVFPGAMAASLVWFSSTLAFGWYVTRVADYSIFYGSFAAGIATLVWLYITTFSALLGAELNGVLFHGRQAGGSADPPASSISSSL
jgi:membrane protein